MITTLIIAGIIAIFLISRDYRYTSNDQAKLRSEVRDTIDKITDKIETNSQNQLDKISDEDACLIAGWFTGVECDHKVINRIDGICVGVCGKHNDITTVSISISNNDVRISYRNAYDHSENPDTTSTGLMRIMNLFTEKGFHEVKFVIN